MYVNCERPSLSMFCYIFASMSGMLDLPRGRRGACMSKLNVSKLGSWFVEGIA